MSRRTKMTAAKAKEKQQRLEAGFVSELFPKVTEITISMLYRQTGESKPLSRTVSFSPGSSATFKLNCLCADCDEGRFDFTEIISAMVKTRKTASKGEISCDRCSAPECADVSYSVKMKHAQTK